MAQSADYTPFSERRITLFDSSVYVRDWSPATDSPKAPVLLLHDSLGSVDLWRDFPSRLASASGRRVFAYDRIGFGRSSERSDRPNASFVSEEGQQVLPALLHALDLEKVVLCGHSVGGGMAIEASVALPERVHALVTIAAQAFVEDRTREGISAAKKSFEDPDVLQRLAKYHGDKAAWVVDAWTEVWLSEAFASFNVERAIAKLQVPSLAIHGERDEYGSALHPQLIANHARGHVCMLDGVGHVPHRECPELLVQVMAKFLLPVE
ncbi:MAG: alpha/beta fold hydrolase [Granulosicoccaceae bacterium]